MGTLICDCDGVLLWWRPTFISWLKKYDLIAPDMPEDEYNFEKYLKIPGTFDTVNSKQFSDTLSNLFNESYYLKSLPPLGGAVDTLRRFHENGYIIKVVSSYTTDYKAMKSREENLINVFGNIFQDIVSLPLRSSKREWLATQDRSSAIFVEDSYNNIKDAWELGFNDENLFLIPHEYNLNQYNLHPIGERIDWRKISTSIFGP